MTDIPNEKSKAGYKFAGRTMVCFVTATFFLQGKNLEEIEAYFEGKHHRPPQTKF